MRGCSRTPRIARLVGVTYSRVWCFAKSECLVCVVVQHCVMGGGAGGGGRRAGRWPARGLCHGTRAGLREERRVRREPAGVGARPLRAADDEVAATSDYLRADARGS